MRESATYQKILKQGVERGLEQGLERGLEQGRLQEARAALLVAGSPRLGTASEAVRTRLEAVDSLERLHALLARVTLAESWDELLPPT